MKGENPHPWLILGDFNAVLGSHEKIGGNPPLLASCNDFMTWTNDGDFVHLPTIGNELTWTNGRQGRHKILQLLDRAICNLELLGFYSSVSCSTLVRVSQITIPFLFLCSIRLVISLHPLYS